VVVVVVEDVVDTVVDVLVVVVLEGEGGPQEESSTRT
jgi:hypothetical protein